MIEYKIDNEKYAQLVELYRTQKQVAFNTTDEYSKGLYDGMEFIVSVLEGRDPELTQLHNGYLM